MPGGPQRLVAGPGVEVGADVVHPHGHLRHGLGGVDQRHGAGGASAVHDLLDRVDRAEHVRHVRDRHELDPALGEHRVELVERELAGLVDAQVAQLGPGLLAEELPGDDVRVVLHVGDEHLVALAHVLPAPRVGDQVDRLGHVAGEDRGGGLPTDERGDPLARPLEQVGGLAGKRIDAAVDVRVRVAVVGVDRSDHLARLLRRGRRVEIRDVGVEQREVRANVERGSHLRHAARSPMNSATWSSAAASFSAIRRRTRASSPGSSRRCTTSSK